MAPKIDHIIVKLPYAELQDLPEWLTKNFTISPGGRHADNKTENKLIVFRDGSYIELIAFINDDPELSKGHWWGEHDYGIIDWALTSSALEDVKAIDERVRNANTNLGANYADPIEGGRKRPDGEEPRWKVTFPENVHRGEVPFWCHDLTARELRVPVGEIATTHPCGALGVAQVTLSAPKTKSEPFTKFYSTLFDSSGISSSFGTLWEIEAPVQDVFLLNPTVSVEAAEENEARYAFVSEVSLLTDTVGLGQSRTTLSETLGGKDIFISFTHGKRG